MRVPFSTYWRMRIVHPYSMLVRAGDLAWSCGQCPLDVDGAVLFPGDAARQAVSVSELIARVLAEGGLAPGDAAKLVLYHAAGEPKAAARAADALAARFPDAMLIPVGVPHFYYAGMLVEVDVHAAAGRGARAVTGEAAGADARVELVAGGGLVWARVALASAAGLDAAKRRLAAAGLGPDRLLAEHWFLAPDAGAPMAEAVAAAGLAGDPGTAVAATLAPGLAAEGELTFLAPGAPLRRESADRDGVRLLFRRGGGRFWLQGRALAAAGLVAETERVMAAIARLLAEEGLAFAAVEKATTHYLGDDSAEALHDNMAVRNRYYERPGPASTGLPVGAFPAAPGHTAIDLLGTAPG